MCYSTPVCERCRGRLLGIGDPNQSLPSHCFEDAVGSLRLDSGTDEPGHRAVSEELQRRTRLDFEFRFL